MIFKFTNKANVEFVGTSKYIKCLFFLLISHIKESSA